MQSGLLAGAICRCILVCILVWYGGEAFAASETPAPASSATASSDVSPLVPAALPGNETPPSPAGEVLQPREISEDDANALLEEITNPAPPVKQAAASPNKNASADKKTPEAPKEKPGVRSQNTKLLPLESPQLAEDNLLIAGVRVSNEDAPDAIEIHTHEHGYFIPLGALTAILNFPITVSPETGKASGWFIQEKRKFFLDMKDQKVSVAGVSKPYIPSLIVKSDRDIYVDSYLLSQWLPITMDLREQVQLLEVNSSETLPQELEEERRKVWARVLAKKGTKPSKVPIVDTPYQAYAAPLIDMNLNDDMQRGRQPLHIGSYSTRITTELDHLTTDAYLNGSTNGKGVDNMRVRARREDETATLFGPMHAKSFEVGDINTFSVPLLGESNPGRGFRISNRDFTRPTEFDATDFIGDAQPGWEIELYWNDKLIDFQVVGDDGQYQFLHVPLYYGDNYFRIVRYGPQGQIEEENKRYLVDDNFLKTNESTYLFSMDQKGRPLFPVSDKKKLKGTDLLRSVGEFEYGLNSALTSRFGYSTTPLDDGRHDYLSTGLRGNAGGALGSVDMAYDTTDSEWANRMLVLSRIWDVNLKGEQKFFSRDFTSETEGTGILGKPSSVSSFDISRSFNARGLPSFTTGVSGEHEIDYGGTKTTTFRYDLNTMLFGLQVGNGISWSRSTGSSTILDTRPQVDGVFSLRSVYNKIVLRADLDYSLRPDQQLDAFMVSAQKDIGKDLFARVALRRGLGDTHGDVDKRLKLSGTLSKNFKDYRLSGIFEVDEKLAVFVGSTLSFSSAFQPQTHEWFASGEQLSNQGAIIARSFLDNNGDGVFNAGDEPVPGVDFTSAGVPATTDRSGAVLIPGHGVGRPSVVEMDLSSLPDPNYYPTGDSKYQVLTRPGLVVDLGFPMSRTSDIDGTVYLTGTQSQSSLPNAVIELLNEDGTVLRTAYSEFDGYYVFEHVPPGHYFVAISESQLQKENLFANYHEITVKNDNEQLTGNDFIVSKSGSAAQVLSKP